MKNIFINSTERMSNLYKRNDLGTYHIGPFDYCKKGDELRSNQYIYITSDEYIGLSWYIDGGYVRKGVIDDKDYWSVRKDYKKIVLTNDPKLLRDGVQEIDEKFLNWFIDNSTCEHIKVVPLLSRIIDPITSVEHPVVQHRHFDLSKMVCEYYYEIQYPTDEPTLYTLEEVRSWLIHRDVYLYNYYTTYKDSNIPLQSVDDFIDENHQYLMNRDK